MEEIDFPQWLINQMDRKGITQADLSKLSGLSTAAISLILSSSRGAGTDACLAIAKALKLPPETVFRAAGLLPPAVKIDARKEMILHLAEQLPDEEYAAPHANTNPKSSHAIS
jgi:transcriptional regulator with XRE-family HTH domain